MILRKFLHLLDLLKVQVSNIYQMAKFVMIYKIKNLVFITFKVVVQSSKYFRNGQEFLIISLISSFYKDYIPENKCHLVPLAYIIRLKKFQIEIFIGHAMKKSLIQSELIKNFTNNKAKSISFNTDKKFQFNIIRNQYFVKSFL